MRFSVVYLFKDKLVAEHLRNVTELKVYAFSNSLSRVSTIEDTVRNNLWYQIYRSGRQILHLIDEKVVNHRPMITINVNVWKYMINQIHKVVMISFLLPIFIVFEHFVDYLFILHLLINVSLCSLQILSFTEIFRMRTMARVRPLNYWVNLRPNIGRSKLFFSLKVSLRNLGPELFSEHFIVDLNKFWLFLIFLLLVPYIDNFLILLFDPADILFVLIVITRIVLWLLHLIIGMFFSFSHFVSFNIFFFYSVFWHADLYFFVLDGFVLLFFVKHGIFEGSVDHRYEISDWKKTWEIFLIKII